MAYSTPPMVSAEYQGTPVLKDIMSQKDIMAFVVLW
jgi:hypothetical protein